MEIGSGIDVGCDKQSKINQSKKSKNRKVYSVLLLFICCEKHFKEPKIEKQLPHLYFNVSFIIIVSLRLNHGFGHPYILKNNNI